MNIDPRFLRSQGRLHEAILSLAASQRPDTISVTQLARVAGVHRSTVYEHADSPEQLLRQAVTAELSRLHGDIEAIGQEPFSQHDAIVELLDYFETREELYRRMNDSSGVVVTEALSSHLASVLVSLCNAQVIALPVNMTELDDETFTRITIRALTDALVRVFSQWLALPAPRDINLALQLTDYVLPVWWDSAEEQAS